MWCWFLYQGTKMMILNCKPMWAGSLLNAIKMWSQLHVWNLLRAELQINKWTSRHSLTWFSKGCLCLCVSHQEVVRVTWLAGSAIAADKRSADTPPNPDIVSLDHNPVLNFSKRGHTSEHDNRIHFLWTQQLRRRRKRRDGTFSLPLMQVRV